MSNPIFLANEIGCSSFTLTKTTKGYTWSIKVYNSDIQKCYDLTKNIDQQAAKDYHISDEPGGP